MIEALLAFFLSLLLVFVMLGAHRASRKVWSQSQERTSTLGRLQAAMKSVNQELRKAPIDSVTIADDGTAVAFLTAEAEDGSVEQDGDGDVYWNRWLIFYQSNNQLMLKSVPWTASANQRKSPVKIEDVLGPLAGHLNGEGRVLFEELESFQANNPFSTSLIHLQVVTTGTDNSRGLEVLTSVRPRN